MANFSDTRYLSRLFANILSFQGFLFNSNNSNRNFGNLLEFSLNAFTEFAEFSDKND